MNPTEQATALEQELLTLLEAEELDDERLAGVVDRRDTHYRAMGELLDEQPELTETFKPVFETALKNTQAMLNRCEAERTSVQNKLITLNTSKKARKAY